MIDRGCTSTGSSSQETIAGTASELNNLLQIISGTTDLIENIWQDAPAAEKYFRMLHTSIGRAAAVTARLLDEQSSVRAKVVWHPDARVAPGRFSRASRHNATPAPAIKRKARILIVDDEPMTLDLAKELLAEAGVEVVTAQSGFDCLGQFSAAPNSFDLVVLDLAMPFMDGEETFDRLRSMRPDIAVLLNTGFVSANKLEGMRGRGLAGVLIKPTPPTDYVATIQALANSAKLARVGGYGTATAN